jgi:hypothetical protein
MGLTPINEDDGFLEALEFVEGLDPRYRICRGARNHNFLDGPQLFGDRNSDGSIHTETKCARCDTIKVEDTTIRGYYIKDPHYVYPKGYLLDREQRQAFGAADMAAAMRVVTRYDRLGEPIPEMLRRPRRRRRAG